MLLFELEEQYHNSMLLTVVTQEANLSDVLNWIILIFTVLLSPVV